MSMQMCGCSECIYADADHANRGTPHVCSTLGQETDFVKSEYDVLYRGDNFGQGDLVIARVAHCIEVKHANPARRLEGSAVGAPLEKASLATSACECACSTEQSFRGIPRPLKRRFHGTFPACAFAHARCVQLP